MVLGCILVWAGRGPHAPGVALTLQPSVPARTKKFGAAMLPQSLFTAENIRRIPDQSVWLSAAGILPVLVFFAAYHLLLENGTRTVILTGTFVSLAAVGVCIFLHIYVGIYRLRRDGAI